MDAVQARLIVPAPPEIRVETGIVWYEARVDTTSRSVRVVGYRSRDEEVAYQDLELGTDGAFRSVIRDEVEIRIDARIGATGDSATIIGTVNGKGFTISDPSRGLEGDLDLTAAERTVLERWGRLADAWEAVAHAIRQSWGVGACSLVAMATGASVGFCAAGALPSCAAALGYGGLFVAQCTD